MNRIETQFQLLQSRGEKALVGFLSAGDPSIFRSLEIIRAMCDAGLDVLELGVPFSDPTADGPVIQRSSARALAGGVSLRTVLDMIAALRKAIEIPIIVFTYYNPVFVYGTRRFYEDAVRAGADGVLVVDLSPEESDEMIGQWPGNALCLIRLIAPTTPEDRIRQVAGSASGFIYMVSKTGVTGSSGLDAGMVAERVNRVRSATNLPLCVGFGVSTPEDVAAIASVADGVVVGSAFERIIEENIENRDLAKLMGETVRSLKAQTRTTQPTH